MKKRYILLFAGSLFFMVFAVQSAQAAGWRFPVGLTYVSNFGKISDIYTDNLEWLGYTTSSSDAVPVGLALQPYYQFDNGLAVGGGIGPLMAVIAESYEFYDVPVALDVRYYIPASASVSPYVRAGVRYHVASGDWVSKSSPGFIGGIGVEFLRNRPISASIELGYDAATIELEKLRTNTTEKVRPGKLTVSIFAVF
jgi:Outer membrane protein beta-barrel domain